MKLLIICKLPPIQGATSINSFNLIRELAPLCSEIDVVTNANEVPNGFKTFYHQSIFNRDSGITVHNTNPFNNSYIPNSKGYLTRIFGLGSELCTMKNYDFIIGWYFQPFGMAATLLSKLYKIPVINLHAGSDITTIFNHQDYNKSISWILKNSDYIVSSCHPNIKHIFNDLKVEGRVFEFNHTPISIEFYQEAPFISINFFKKITISHYKGYFQEDILRKLIEINSIDLKTNAKSILIFGKIGRHKATLALLKTLSRLQNRLNIIWIPAGNKSDLKALIENLHKLDQAIITISIICPVDNRLLPSFIDMCDVVVYLENNFPVSIHTPRIPREVLLRKKAFMCSNEVLKNTPIYSNLVHGRNVISVLDPNNAEELYRHFKAITYEDYNVNDIGFMGYQQVISWESSLFSQNSLGKTVKKILNVQ